MKFRLFTLFLLFFSLQSQAQNFTSTLRGEVIDKDSRAKIIAATIAITSVNPMLASYSNDKGEFSIVNIPVGRQQIRVTCLGYSMVEMNNIIITTGKELFITIELEPQTNMMREIVIKDSTKERSTINSMVSVSGQSFSPEETNRYAGSRIDPSRMVANFAGVISANDSRNEVIVRGNAPNGVLWRLEGIDIPNPNHFTGQGASGGALSILNNNLLSGSDFLTGAFPAEYGNKNAAVFDLRLRNGNKENHEYTAAIGVNGLELGAEGPFSKKHNSSYLFNYRYSTFAFFETVGLQFGIAGIPTYQDATIKLNFAINKKNVISIFAIGGISNVAVLDSKRDSSDWSFTSQGEDVNYGTKMLAAAISHTHFFTNNTYGKLSLSVGANELNIQVDTLSSPESKSLTYKNNSSEINYSIQYLFSSKINNKNSIKIGSRFSLLSFSYLEKYYENLYKKFVDLINTNGNTSLASAYFQWQHRFSDNLKLNAGVYSQYFLLNKSKSIEPRAGLVYQVHKHRFKTGIGLHAQSHPLVVYYFESFNPIDSSYTKTNKELDFTKSLHYVIGDDISITKNILLKTELYYQYIFNAPVEKYISSSRSLLNLGGEVNYPNYDSLINKGIGRNYGIEITLEKMFSNHYYCLFTSSLFKSEYQGSDKIWRNTKFDNNYVFNLLAGYEYNFSKQNKNSISFDLRLNYAGGQRYTPIDLEKSQLFQKQILEDDKAFSKQYAAYFRCDLKVAFKINQKKITHSFFATVENVSNRKNILQQFYEPINNRIRTDFQLGIFPYGGYRVEF
jgi:hypothetical protein